MTVVSRLLTFVDADGPTGDPHRMSVSARHVAVLTNGDQVLLLADRGWTSSGPPDIWTRMTVRDIADTARAVVGPDEPFDGRSREDMESGHWAFLAEIIQRHGIEVDGPSLQGLPHDVVISAQLLGRIGDLGSDETEP